MAINYIGSTSQPANVSTPEGPAYVDPSGNYYKVAGQAAKLPPTAPPASPTGGGTGTQATGGLMDYYKQALELLKPITEAQTAPLKQMQDLIPGVFSQKKAALEKSAETTQAIDESIRAGAREDLARSKQIIGASQMSELGSQRATAAARGITETSGVEQSQEANIAQGWASKLYDLDTKATRTDTTLGLQEKKDLQDIQDKIAELPMAEAQASLDVASKIAEVTGGGAKEALQLASTFSQQASLNAYRESELALRAGNLELANSRYDESVRHNQVTEGLSALAKEKPSATERTADIQAQIRDDAATSPDINTFKAKWIGTMSDADLNSIWNVVRAGKASSQPNFFQSLAGNLGGMIGSLIPK